MRALIHALSRRWGFSPLGWLRNTWRMRAWVRATGPLHQAPAPDAPHIGVVITPWLDTTVPWFTLAAGLLLACRGNRVRFLIDDSPFGDSPVRYRLVLRCLRFVLARVPVPCTQVLLSSQRARPTTPGTPDAHAAVERLAKLNAVWQLRGEMLPTGRAEYTRICSAQLAKADAPIAQLLQPGAFDLLFMPGGVYGNSGLWALHARAAGIRIASFDAGGYGTVMVASNGIACQLQDIPLAFQQLKGRCAVDPTELRFAVDAALAEMAKRRAGVDAFASQMQGGHGGDARFDGAVLLALNSSWDAAALGLHAVYRDNTAWIVETVRYLLDHTSAPVIVRQHPAERLPIAYTSDDYGSLLRQHFGTQPRLHFIAADETINSYQLLERVAAVVVYTSTIGTEAAALGKPVITPSHSYYAGLGFVWQCTDLASYHARLADAAQGLLQVTPAMRDDAHLCYYLTQCCNWVFSPFNPSDFQEWATLGPAHWLADATVQGVLASLQQGVPVATLNHHAALARRLLCAGPGAAIASAAVIAHATPTAAASV